MDLVDRNSTPDFFENIIDDRQVSLLAIPSVWDSDSCAGHGPQGL